MKYLKIIIFACIVLQTIFTFSQFEDTQCGFIPDEGMYASSKYTGTVRSNFSQDDPIVFNVFYHVVNPSNGINPYGVTEDNILTSIAQLNINYNPYNIFYKYSGYRTINNDSIYDNTDEGDFYDVLNLEQDYPNYINVMIIPPRSNIASSDRLEQWIIYDAQFFALIDLYNETSITHEFGHLAGLFHTFAGTVGVPSCYSVPDSGYCIDNDVCIPISGVTQSPDFLNTPHFSTPDYWSENVTREEFLPDGTKNPYFNAKDGGDRVVDTPASFVGADNNYCFDLTTNTITYISNPNIVDNSGTNEIYVEGNLQNFMSYTSNLVVPRTFFTNGQVTRMKEEILSPNNTQYTPRMSLLPDGTADLSVLYEPYKNSYYGAGPTLPEHRTLFQPGFDYYFVDCSGNYNTPSDYYDTSFSFNINSVSHINKESLDFNNITHPNHTAIFINQLNADDLKHGGQPRKCYNNTNRLANHGTVIKFEDGVPNTNVTIHPKDQTEINDENLIQNLDNGLYIIKKNYDDGTQEQQTINKSGN